MCVTAIIAGVALLTSAVGTVASIGAANANAANAQYQADVQTKQLNEQRRTAEIQALEQENERTAEFRRTRSAALAAIGASGLGEHISFFQGIDPSQQEAYLRDVRAVRLNLVQKKSSIADEITVAGYSAQIAKANASAQKIGAVANFAQTAMSVANFYNTNKTPGG